jgi:hypothetical protein
MEYGRRISNGRRLSRTVALAGTGRSSNLCYGEALPLALLKNAAAFSTKAAALKIRGILEI